MATAIAAMAMMSMLVVVRPAYADVSITMLLTKGPFVFTALFFLELINSALSDFLVPLCSTMFQWSTDYLSIPYVNTVVLGLQALAIVAVVAIRIANGVTSGILLSGGNREGSLGEYIFKTLSALIVVATMPILCNLVMKFGNFMFADVIHGAGSVADSMSWMTLGDNWDTDKISSADDQLVHAALWSCLGLFVMVIFTFACGYQFLRRQVEMLVVSLIGPIVAVYSATEDDTNQVYDLLRKLFALCCIMWIQYLLVKIALEFGFSWISMATVENNNLLATLFQGDGAVRFMFCLAFFMTALTVPSLVEQFSFGNGGSRVGGVAVGAVVSRAFRGPKMPMGGK